MKLLWKLANAIHLGLYRLTSGRIGGRMGDGTILLLTKQGAHGAGSLLSG